MTEGTGEESVIPAKAGISANGHVLRSHDYYVYILCNRRDGPLYVGMTNDVVRRISEHRLGEVPGFTKQYRIHRLVWFEHHGDVDVAIVREKRIKRWNRDWKMRLVAEINPCWDDLAVTKLGMPHLERSPPARG
ncbi:MAG: GIY-YIG nuclease family protein [Pacificimonas sp.]|jgi:putative endonuclease|nr:GIY-YIG nuclease family protein [Pacificimonas sp.]